MNTQLNDGYEQDFESKDKLVTWTEGDPYRNLGINYEESESSCLSQSRMYSTPKHQYTQIKKQQSSSLPRKILEKDPKPQLSQKNNKYTENITKKEQEKNMNRFVMKLHLVMDRLQMAFHQIKKQSTRQLQLDINSDNKHKRIINLDPLSKNNSRNGKDNDYEQQKLSIVLEQCESIKHRYEMSLTNLQNTIKEQELIIQTKSRKNKQLLDVIFDIQNKNDGQMYKNQIQQQQQQISSIQTQFDQLNYKYLDSCEFNTELKIQIKEKEEQYMELREYNSLIKDENNSLKNEIEEITVHIEQVIKEREEMNDQIEQLQKELRLQLEDKETIQIQLKDLQNQYQQMCLDHFNLNTDYESLYKQNEDLKDLIERKERDEIEDSNKWQQIENENNEIAKENEEIKLQLNQVKMHFDRYKRDQEALLQESDFTNKECHKLSAYNKSLLQENEELLAHNEDLISHNEGILKEYDQLRSNNQKQIIANSQLQQQNKQSFMNQNIFNAVCILNAIVIKNHMCNQQSAFSGIQWINKFHKDKMIKAAQQNANKMVSVSSKSYIERRRLVSFSKYLFYKYKKVIGKTFFLKLKSISAAHKTNKKMLLESHSSSVQNKKQHQVLSHFLKIWKKKTSLYKMLTFIKKQQLKKYSRETFDNIVEYCERQQQHNIALRLSQGISKLTFKFKKILMRQAFCKLLELNITNQLKYNQRNLSILKCILKQRKSLVIQFMTKWRLVVEQMKVNEATCNHISQSVLEQNQQIKEQVNQFLKTKSLDVSQIIRASATPLRRSNNSTYYNSPSLPQQKSQRNNNSNNKNNNNSNKELNIKDESDNQGMREISKNQTANMREQRSFVMNKYLEDSTQQQQKQKIKEDLNINFTESEDEQDNSRDNVPEKYKQYLGRTSNLNFSKSNPIRMNKQNQ